MELHLESQPEGNLALICVVLSPIQDVINHRCKGNEGTAATYCMDPTVLKSPRQKSIRFHLQEVKNRQN